MTLCLKKISLLIIVVPASIHWLGIFSLGVAIYTVIHYLKISKFAVYSIGLGCGVLLVALYMRLYTETPSLISVCFLFLGGMIIIIEYVRGT
tara:strand:- start:574 stop:849 length:276 start_codon:yes stop_codon:yes gene_type:complete